MPETLVAPTLPAAPDGLVLMIAAGVGVGDIVMQVGSEDIPHLRERRLFVLLTKIALNATEFFRIPPHRVVAPGGQIES